MDPFGEERPRPKPETHVIGQDLALLSVGDLDERVVLLEAEVARLRQAREAKQAALEAAGAFFKR